MGVFSISHTYEYIVARFEERGYELSTKEYKDAHQKLDFICKKHPYFKNAISYNSLQQGGGCIACAREKIGDARRIDLNRVVQDFSDRGYVLLEDKYLHSHAPMRYQCKFHPDKILRISYSNLVQGKGCPYCGAKRAAIKRRKSFDDVVCDFNKRGYELIAKESDYINGKSKLRYRCPFHKDKETYISYHALISGKGCPYCKKSKGENRISEILDKKKIKYIQEYKIPECRNQQMLPFDFAILGSSGDLTCLIEYDGEAHEKPVNFGGISDECARERLVRQKQNDFIKTNYCLKNKIPLLRISYKNFKNIESILLKELIV